MKDLDDERSQAMNAQQGRAEINFCGSRPLLKRVIKHRASAPKHITYVTTASLHGTGFACPCSIVPRSSGQGLPPQNPSQSQRNTSKNHEGNSITLDSLFSRSQEKHHSHTLLPPMHGELVAVPIIFFFQSRYKQADVLRRNPARSPLTPRTHKDHHRRNVS